MCYCNIHVTQFVPNPLRCYKCRKFGHVSSKCKHSVICARCSETGHNDDSCTKAFKCANCGEYYTTYTKKCSIYKKSMTISHSGCRGIYFKARMVYQKTYRQRVMSYSGASKAPIQSTSGCTQTEVSWVGSQPVTRKQCPAVSSTSNPVSSPS